MSIWKKLFSSKEVESIRPLEAPVLTQAIVKQPEIDVESPQISAPPPATDPLQATANEFIEKVHRALPKLSFLMVGHIETEQQLAFICPNPALNGSQMAKHVAAMVKQEASVLNGLFQAENELLGDVLLSVSGEWHLLEMINNQSHYVYLVISSSEANLVIVRSTLLEALPTLIP
jgi:hypothetical protein